MNALYFTWETLPPQHEVIGLIAGALGIRFDQMTVNEDLAPDAFGLSLNRKAYPKFNPLSFDFETSHNGKQ